MGANEKLLEKMRRIPTPNDITMNELDRLLRSEGFVIQSQNGSHLNYKHENLKYILTIVSHDKKQEVKVVYIKNTLNALDELGN
jgi:predicted RNA binding protein YcfA (HicA-like mRNA interferase family)